MPDILSLVVMEYSKTPAHVLDFGTFVVRSYSQNEKFTLQKYRMSRWMRWK